MPSRKNWKLKFTCRCSNQDMPRSKSRWSAWSANDLGIDLFCTPASAQAKLPSMWNMVMQGAEVQLCPWGEGSKGH